MNRPVEVWACSRCGHGWFSFDATAGGDLCPWCGSRGDMIPGELVGFVSVQEGPNLEELDQLEAEINGLLVECKTNLERRKAQDGHEAEGPEAGQENRPVSSDQ